MPIDAGGPPRGGGRPSGKVVRAFATRTASAPAAFDSAHGQFAWTRSQPASPRPSTGSGRNWKRTKPGVPEAVGLSPGVYVAFVKLEPTGDGLLDPALDGGAFTRLYIGAAGRDAAAVHFAEWAADNSVRIGNTEWCCDCSELPWTSPADADAAVDIQDEVLCVNAARSDRQIVYGILYIWPADATE